MPLHERSPMTPADLKGRMQAFPKPPFGAHYRRQDAALYALSVGAGDDPLDQDALPYLLHEDIAPLPSFATVISTYSPWLFDPANGIDSKAIILTEMTLRLHEALPLERDLLFHERVDHMWDRGPDRGAPFVIEGDIVDKATDRLIASIDRHVLARKDGGFGGEAPPPKNDFAAPDRPADFVHLHATRPDAALLFRLHGDLHPFHHDLAFVRAQGLERPVLHGMCTFGIASVAVLKGPCRWQAGRIREISAQFKTMAFPGDTVRTESWVDGDAVTFRSTVVERDTVVLVGRVRTSN